MLPGRRHDAFAENLAGGLRGCPQGRDQAGFARPKRDDHRLLRVLRRPRYRRSGAPVTICAKGHALPFGNIQEKRQASLLACRAGHGGHLACPWAKPLSPKASLRRSPSGASRLEAPPIRRCPPARRFAQGLPSNSTFVEPSIGRAVSRPPTPITPGQAAGSTIGWGRLGGRVAGVKAVRERAGGASILADLLVDEKA